MPQLSQHDRDLIAIFPLNDCLDFLRDRLRATDTPLTDAAIQGLRKAISLLVAALMGHEAAYKLESKHCGTHLASELLEAFTRIQNGPFNYEHFRPLASLVVEQASDADIWEAVFSLLDAPAHATPPPTAPTFSDDTPVVRSSSSFQGSEQSRRILDPALFYEVQHCTYRNVYGFFEKYFDGKSWEKKTKRILRSVKTSTKRRRKWYDSERWTDISDQPTQEEQWDWFSKFQAEFLSGSSNTYHVAMHTNELEGAEAKRQLDVFVKKRIHGVRRENAKHDWKDVHVVGELKQSEGDFKALLLQLTRYARDVFTVQPTRRFFHAFTIQGTVMELWVFDRSGPYSSGSFDIHREPEKFIKALTGYASMNDTELGLDTYIERKGTDHFIAITSDASEMENRIQLENCPFVKQRAIVCRGTTCFRTADGGRVAKFSWTSDKRPLESELLRLACEKSVEGIAQFVGYEQLATIDQLRSGMTFQSPHRFKRIAGSTTGSFSLCRSFGPFQRLSVSYSKRKHNEQEEGTRKRSRPNSQTSKLRQQRGSGQPAARSTSLYETDDSRYSNRVLGCLVISPAGRALCTFRSLKELVTALRDAIKGHYSLYMKANILHRDISENNIIITDPDVVGGFTGMLIDLDLAKIVGSGRSGARHQTGTVEFMAIQVLQRTAHTYRHDLESFLYVLLWVCARRTWEMEFNCKLSARPKRNILKKWYTGDFEDIADAKRGYMHADGFERVLEEFPDTLEDMKPLCRQLRKILFPLYQSGELDTGTHTCAEDLYSKVLETYGDALAELDAQTNA